MFQTFSLWPETWLSQEDAGNLISRISAELSTVKTLKVGFIQERELWAFQDKLTSWGICYFQDPDRLRWEVTEPYRAITIYNDNNVAKFDFNENGFYKLNLGVDELMKAIMKEILFWMKGDFVQLDNYYTMQVKNDEELKVYSFVLKPKSPDVQKFISQIEINFDRISLHILFIQITEPSDDSITITFYNEENNIPIDSSFFDLNHPKVQ